MPTLAVGATEILTIVAVAGDQSTAVLGSQVDTSQLPESLRPALEQQRVQTFDLDVGSVKQVMGYAPKLGEMVITPLLMRGELRGALIVASDHRLAEDCTEGLATLAAEVALALESAALAEDLHRRRSEARFRSLVRGSSDVIMIVDADGVIQYASPSTERVLGYAGGRSRARPTWPSWRIRTTLPRLMPFLTMTRRARRPAPAGGVAGPASATAPGSPSRRSAPTCWTIRTCAASC